MKYLVSYNESIQPYKFQYEGHSLTALGEMTNSEEWDLPSFVYNFTDGTNQFKVLIYVLPGETTEVGLIWTVKVGEEYKYDIVSTNIYRLLKTILGDILNHFTSRNKWCTLIAIKGLSKDKEKEEVSSRTKVYYRYLQQNPINGWDLDRSGNEIYLYSNADEIQGSNDEINVLKRA